MPTSEIGERGIKFGQDVKKRRGSNLSLRALSERLREIGRPILPSGLLKIERGERRVDIDDLEALAAAFGVPMSRMLLPADATVPLTAAERDDHREVIDRAIGAVQEAVRLGLPLYGLLDYIELVAGPMTTEQGRPDIQSAYLGQFEADGSIPHEVARRRRGR